MGQGQQKATKVNGTKKKQLEEQVKMIVFKKKAEFPRIKDGQRFTNLYKTACTACVEQVQNNVFNVKLKRF